MFKGMMKRFTSLVMTVAMVFSILVATPLKVEAASVNTGVTGLSADSSGSGSWSYSNGTITGTVTASSSSSCTGTTYTAQTDTLTLKNNSGSKAALAFSYSLELNGGSATIGGASASGGNYTTVLENGGTLAVAITSPSAEGETKITISSISLTVEKDVSITFAVAEHGSYTVDGTAIISETSISKKTTESFALVATPESGYKFKGWYSVTDDSYFSSVTTCDALFEKNQTVKPLFVPSASPLFEVGSKIFDDLNEAVAYSVSGSISKITLVSNGTLPAGSYAIPNGKTLLIPFDAAKTAVKETPMVIYNSYAAPTAYRILTMADGAVITVQNGGAISLGSQLSSKGQLGGTNGTPTGPDGRINMQSGSNITLENGANLYCWGYIYGSGSVTAKSGATVYEAFQIKDWRGGTATSNVYDYAFIFSQYYIQNIEVPLTLYAGATEKLYSSVNASSSAYPMGATFLGNGGLFNLTSGYIVKDYIENTDRLSIQIYGNSSITPMSITGLPIIGSVSTNDYELPINSNFTVDIKSGTTTVTQDIKLLPSVEVKVAKEAKLSIASGKKVYLYDKDDWGKFTGNAQIYVIGYSAANGTATKRTAAGLTDATLDVNGTVTVTGNLYTSAGGANIISSGKNGTITYSTAPGTANSTIYEMAENKTKTEVAFNPAKLHNGPARPAEFDEYISTSGASAGKSYLYCSVCDVWYHENDASNHEHTHTHSLVKTEAVAATCALPGNTAYWTCSECGKFFSDENGENEIAENSWVIPALGHDWDDPTYVWSAGNSSVTATRICKRDGAHVETETVSATAEITTPATCTNAGVKTWTSATFTNPAFTVQTKTEAIPTTEHIPGEPVRENEVTATCSKEGSYDEVVYCSVCNEELSRTPKMIEKLPHTPGDPVRENEVAATCAKEGSYDEVVYCSVCHEELSRETKTIEKLAHTPGEAVRENEVAATCSKEGSYDEVVYCSVCHEELSRETKTIEKLAHTPGEAVRENEVAATCTAEGSYDEVVYCSVCHEELSRETKTIEKLAHTPAEAVREKEVAATCSKEGSYDEVVYCSVCHEELSRTPKTIEKLAHTPGEAVREKEVAATCTAEGNYDEVVYCSVCHVELSRQAKTIPALGHAWGEPVWSWNGHESATATFTCSRDASHTRTVDAVITSVPGTGEDVGFTVYTATVTGPDGKMYTNMAKEPLVFTIIWKNWNGTVLETDEDVRYGTTPTYDGAQPTKDADAQYSYTFKGWTPEVTAVTEDATYTAVFEPVLRSYTVIWKNWDGTVLETDENVPYGTTPTYDGETPVKTGNAQFSYTFTGWDPAVASVTGDAEYTAQFGNETNSYTVTWKNWDGTELEKDENVPYGTMPSYDGAQPVKAGDAQYSYAFAGWNPVPATVTGNVTYTAVFKESVNTYTVTWKNYDGTVLETDEQVPYGTTPTFDGAEPVRASTDQYTYSFKGWDPAVASVTGNAVYTATFTETVRTYTVIWKNYDGNVLETDNAVPYGTTPSYDGAEPARAFDEKNHYSFTGWTPAVKEVSRNAEYTAEFAAEAHVYAEPAWTWTKTEDGYTATATFTCECGRTVSVAAKNVTSEVTTEPTVDAEGVRTYTATVIGPDGKSYTGTHNEAIPALQGHHIIVTDYTKGKAATSIVVEQLYSGDVTFTVSDENDQPCLIAVKEADGSYRRLICTTDEGIHSYALTVTADMELVVIYKGDVNLDGRVTSRDGNAVSKFVVETMELTLLQQLVADANEDGSITSRDGNKISKVVVETANFTW